MSSLDLQKTYKISTLEFCGRHETTTTPAETTTTPVETTTTPAETRITPAETTTTPSKTTTTLAHVDKASRVGPWGLWRFGGIA